MADSSLRRPAGLRASQPWWDQLGALLEPDQENDNDNQSEYSQAPTDHMEGIEYHSPIPGPAFPRQTHSSPLRRRRSPPRPVANATPASTSASAPHHEPSGGTATSSTHINDLSTCPKCGSVLGPDPGSAEAHLRGCFGDEAIMEACPVCALSIGALSERDKEAHVAECCRVGVGGAVSGVGVQDHAGEWREGAVLARCSVCSWSSADLIPPHCYIVFICSDRSVPKDEATGEPLEVSGAH